MTIALLLLILINATSLPFVVFAWFPRCLRSLMRYRLWELRDRVWDARYHGSLADTDAAQQLVEIIERSIKRPESFALSRVLPSYMSVRSACPTYLMELREKADHELRLIYGAASDPLVVELGVEYGRIITRYSTLGWVMMAYWHLVKRKDVLQSTSSTSTRSEYAVTGDKSVTDFVVAANSLRIVRETDRALSSCVT